MLSFCLAALKCKSCTDDDLLSEKSPAASAAERRKLRLSGGVAADSIVLFEEGVLLLVPISKG
ncbi:unnamed protein product [Symbiodinium sp. KB8]|nr:unnamed protein product [Symbiodinium sp. KB8]